MEFLLCIDDTDTIDSIGTGTICEMIRGALQDTGKARCSWITRHQLLIHEAIPYTSHNSSMCFHGIMALGSKKAIINTAIRTLVGNCAKASDPGLCVAFLEDIADKKSLIAFGERAQKQVLTKAMAYKLAEDNDIHLSEHGGTGQGIIGALAGIGLRLSGNNGELKGAMKGVTSLSSTVEHLKSAYPIQRIMTQDGSLLPDNTTVRIEMPTKIIYQDHLYTLLVDEMTDGYRAWDKKRIRQKQMSGKCFEQKKGSTMINCHGFKPDVEEERIEEGVKDCFNCTYRRWTAQGISCLNKS